MLLPRLLRAPSAAAYLGVSESTLRDLGIPRRRIEGKQVFAYDRHDLDRYADSLPYEGEAAKAENTCDSLFGASG